jgi:hypothetical protein
LVEQSTGNSILISIFSCVFSKSNIFYDIEPPQEYTGSEATSSSEDGKLHWQVSRPLGWW